MLLGIIKNETNNEHYFLHIDDKKVRCYGAQKHEEIL